MEPLEQLVKHETEESILLINEQLVVAIARGFAILWPSGPIITSILDVRFLDSPDTSYQHE